MNLKYKVKIKVKYKIYSGLNQIAGCIKNRRLAA